jgi:uncharacterized protein YkwD
VPPARRFLATALSILSCTVLSASPAAASSRSSASLAETNGWATIAGRARNRTRSLCATAHRRSARRRRRTARGCKQTTPKRTPKAPKSATRRLSTPPAPTPAPSVTAAGHAGAQNTAASIAAVLATPCQNTELTPTAENGALVRASILCLINRKRAENGESPLELSPDLEQAAEGHCHELILEDYFAHVSPTGETPVDRIRSTGYIPGPSVGYVIGENLAWGTYQLSTPASIVAAWIASPGHLANILEAQYRETGIGVTPAVPSSLSGGSPGATYAQEFGVIIR